MYGNISFKVFSMDEEKNIITSIPDDVLKNLVKKVMMNRVSSADFYRDEGIDMEYVHPLKEFRFNYFTGEKVDDSETIKQIEEYYKKCGANAVPFIFMFDDQASVYTLDEMYFKLYKKNIDISEVPESRLDEVVEYHLNFLLFYNHIAELMSEAIRENPDKFIENCENKVYDFDRFKPHNYDNYDPLDQKRYDNLLCECSDYSNPEVFAQLLGNIYDISKKKAEIIYNDWMMRENKTDLDKQTKIDRVLDFLPDTS